MDLCGPERVTLQGPPLTGSYLLIGNGDGEGGCMVHNPGYDFNDDNLAIGAAYWALLTERFLEAT